MLLVDEYQYIRVLELYDSEHLCLCEVKVEFYQRCNCWTQYKLERETVEEPLTYREDESESNKKN